MLSVLIFVAAVMVSARDYNIVFENKSQKDGLGLYYVGNMNDEEHIPGTEAFQNYIAPSGRAAHSSNFGDRFVLRAPVSEDGPSFRFAVEVSEGGEATNGIEFPFGINFQAIGLENDAAIELRHRGADDHEFIWIEAGHTVGHLTGERDEFVLRDRNNTDRVGVTLVAVEKSEL